MPRIDQAKGWYDASDPVHGLDHVLRVYRMAERLGEELGADLEILRAAALLHDAAGAAPSGMGLKAGNSEPQGARHSHELSSAEFAAHVLEAEGWEEARIAAVAHCIRAHRYRSREAPESLEAKILYDADKLDVLGAFGIARTIGYAVQAGQPIYTSPSQQFLQEGRLESDEPHSAYHEYLFKLRWVWDRLHSQAARQIGAERKALLDAFFQRLAKEADAAD